MESEDTMTEQEKKELLDELEKRIDEKYKGCLTREDVATKLKAPREKWFIDDNGIGCKYTVGEIIKKTDDEFWVRLNNYCELDNSTNQTDITCSFVWEDGGWK